MGHGYIIFRLDCAYVIRRVDPHFNAQGERISLLRREKEAILKAEAGDAARRACILSDARADDLELKLQQCMSDCDTLQLRVTDAAQASGVFYENFHDFVSVLSVFELVDSKIVFRSFPAL